MKTYPKLGLLAVFAFLTGCATSALSPTIVGVGPQEFPAGDSVTITEVLSNPPGLDIGSRVVVRGRYTLVSEARARISLSQTRTESRAAVPVISGSGMDIAQGSGEFELVYQVTQIGCMRVALNRPTGGGSSFGTMYFGTRDQLARVNREVRDWVK